MATGARFAPSVAKIFMAHWEAEAVFNNRPSQLVCYKRYKDDLFVIWVMRSALTLS